MKGIILAGGSGTRLYPLTKVTSKQLLPVFDKPMIYYPLGILMEAGIRDILIISTPLDTTRFEALFGNGSAFGLHISYCVQPSPDGLAQAFILGETFIGDDACAMILGDNIFYGDSLKEKLIRSVKTATEHNEATIFGYKVNDPERFGVVSFDENMKAQSIEEKPTNPRSNYAVSGLYFYPKGVSVLAKTIKPSKARGELEITDLNNLYLSQGKLCVEILDEDITWFDTGTHESLLSASNNIERQERNSGKKVCCLEEIAYKNGWISKEQVLSIANTMANNEYGQYLKEVVNRGK